MPYLIHEFARQDQGSGDREIGQTWEGVEFDGATWFYKARELPKQEFRREVKNRFRYKLCGPNPN
jgi:hypothetical protein